MKVVRETISIQNLKVLKSDVVLTSSKDECLRYIKYQHILHSLVFKTVLKDGYLLINQNKFIKKYLLK